MSMEVGRLNFSIQNSSNNPKFINSLLKQEGDYLACDLDRYAGTSARGNRRFVHHFRPDFLQRELDTKLIVMIKNRILYELGDHKPNPVPELDPIHPFSLIKEIEYLDYLFQLDPILPTEKLIPPTEDGTRVIDVNKITPQQIIRELVVSSSAYNSLTTNIDWMKRPLLVLGSGTNPKELMALDDKVLAKMYAVITDLFPLYDKILANYQVLNNNPNISIQPLRLSGSVETRYRVREILSDLYQKTGKEPMLSILGVLCMLEANEVPIFMNMLMEEMHTNSNLLIGNITGLVPVAFYGQTRELREQLFLSHVLSIIKLHYKDFPLEKFPEIDVHTPINVTASEAFQNDFEREPVDLSIYTPYALYKLANSYTDSQGNQCRLMNLSVTGIIMPGLGLIHQPYYQGQIIKYDPQTPPLDAYTMSEFLNRLPPKCSKRPPQASHFPIN